jgi:hypothetical protein
MPARPATLAVWLTCYSDSKRTPFLKDFSDNRSKPLNIFFIQLITGGSALDNSGDPPGIFEHLQMLGNGGLGNGQIFDNIAGDAPRMGYQKLNNFKTDGVAQGLQHADQTVLFVSRDIQCATCGWNRCFVRCHGFVSVYRNFTVNNIRFGLDLTTPTLIFYGPFFKMN